MLNLINYYVLGQNATQNKCSVEGRTILPSNELNVLRVTIDKDFKCHKHVSDVCCKVARQINVLTKLHSVLDREAVIAIYSNFMFSNFNYFPVVWYFWGIQCSQTMQRPEERTLRFGYKDFVSIYTELLAKGNHSILYINKLRSIATEIYKD